MTPKEVIISEIKEELKILGIINLCSLVLLYCIFSIVLSSSLWWMQADGDVLYEFLNYLILMTILGGLLFDLIKPALEVFIDKR